MEAATLLRNARSKAGLTQAALARRLGKSQPSVAGLERRGANPTVETLEEVLHATGHRLELRAVKHASSVDEALVASYMRMNPAERLRNFQSAHDSLAELKAATTRGDAKPA